MLGAILCVLFLNFNLVNKTEQKANTQIMDEAK